MIGRLEARLRENPNDINGLEMLVRSHIALGQENRAQSFLNWALTEVESGNQKYVRDLLDKLAGKTKS